MTRYESIELCGLVDDLTFFVQIVSFNLAYVGMVKTAGSETNLLALSLPKTLSGLVAGIAQLFGGMANDPALSAAFPNLVVAAQGGVTALQALALEQMFTLSPLGGMSVTELTAIGVPPSLLTGFPYVPEYASWAAASASLPVSSVSIPTPTSTAMYVSVVNDDTGETAAGTLAASSTSLAASLSIPPFQAQLWQGFLQHAMTTYGKDAFAAMLGPALGANSSGILIKRTVQEWIFGYEDPVVSPTYPAGDPRRIIRSVTKIRDARTIQNDHVPWNLTDTSTWAHSYGSTPYHVATGVGAPRDATKILSRSDGSGPVIYPHTGHVESVLGKDIATGQYHDIKKNGVSVDVKAWADFGMGLDLKRSLTLRHRPGRAVQKNDKVSVEIFGVAHEEFMSCPVNQTACGRNANFYGIFNVTGFELVPSVYTLPHGHRADPRLFGGYVDPTSSASPFSPNPAKHDIEFSIYEHTGNTFGMRVPIQQNFKIDRTDLFFTTLWSGAAMGDHFYVPISWTSLEYDVGDDVYDSIKDTVTHIELLVATWTYICPALCFMGILFSAVTLYVRRALNRRLVDNDRRERETTRDDSHAIGSYREKTLVSSLRKKHAELLDESSQRSDEAPASPDVADAV